MATIKKDVRERFIDKIRPFKRIEPVPRISSAYTTFNEVILDVRYSGLMKKGNYWFFMDTHRLNPWRGKRRFIECFICGDENLVVLVPDDKIFEWYDGIEPNRKGHWFLNIFPQDEQLLIKIGHGRPDIDAREYINRFDLISPIIPRPIPTPLTVPQAEIANFEQVRASIISDTSLQGDSLHDRVVDLLAKIGEWFNYEPKKSYSVEPGSPYKIDLVWLKGNEIDLAAEVHDGGNETEAKDRLRQAIRFGARKVLIVSVPNAIPRLRSVCRFESDLRNWLEIWSVSRIYEMYRNGGKFFEQFHNFKHRQRSEDITEFL